MATQAAQQWRDRQLPVAPDLNDVRSAFTLNREIGHGSFGVVFAATRKSDGEEVVIKKINIDGLSPVDREAALQEASTLSHFNHANIIRYHDSQCLDGYLYIVMEYAGSGDLASLIKRRALTKKSFPEDQILFWFVQICLALWHVHSRNFLHRDLKSQNVFVATGNVLKLGDFGIARMLHHTCELANTSVGTPYYLSPEICEDQPYDSKSDVWALGCILYELTTLKRAFDGQSLPALVVKILRGRFPPLPSKYSSDLKKLIRSMLSQHPKDRPSAESILKLPWIRKHLERYAAHMTSLTLPTTLTSRPSLGLDASNETSAQRLHRLNSAGPARQRSLNDDGNPQECVPPPMSRSYFNAAFVLHTDAASAPLSSESVDASPPITSFPQPHRCHRREAESAPLGAALPGGSVAQGGGAGRLCPEPVPGVSVELPALQKGGRVKDSVLPCLSVDHNLERFLPVRSSASPVLGKPGRIQRPAVATGATVPDPRIAPTHSIPSYPVMLTETSSSGSVVGDSLKVMHSISPDSGLDGKPIPVPPDPVHYPHDRALRASTPSGTTRECAPPENRQATHERLRAVRKSARREQGHALVSDTWLAGNFAQLDALSNQLSEQPPILSPTRYAASNAFRSSPRRPHSSSPTKSPSLKPQAIHRTRTLGSPHRVGSAPRQLLGGSYREHIVGQSNGNCRERVADEDCVDKLTQRKSLDRKEVARIARDQAERKQHLQTRLDERKRLERHEGIKEQIQIRQGLKAAKSQKEAKSQTAHRTALKGARSKILRDDMVSLGRAFSKRTQATGGQLDSLTNAVFTIQVGVDATIGSTQEADLHPCALDALPTEKCTEENTQLTASMKTPPSIRVDVLTGSKSGSDVGLAGGESPTVRPWRVRRDKKTTGPTLEIFVPLTPAPIPESKDPAATATVDTSNMLNSPSKQPEGTSDVSRMYSVFHPPVSEGRNVPGPQEDAALSDSDDDKDGFMLCGPPVVSHFVPAPLPLPALSKPDSRHACMPRREVCVPEEKVLVASSPQHCEEAVDGVEAELGVKSVSETTPRSPGGVAASSSGRDQQDDGGRSDRSGAVPLSGRDQPSDGGRSDKSKAVSHVVKVAPPVQHLPKLVSQQAMTAMKIEELRMSLEGVLGSTKLLEAYRYLQDVESQEHDSLTQANLERILGSQVHFAYQIYKLLTLEELVFR